MPLLEYLPFSVFKYLATTLEGYLQELFGYLVCTYLMSEIVTIL